MISDAVFDAFNLISLATWLCSWAAWRVVCDAGRKFLDNQVGD